MIKKTYWRLLMAAMFVAVMALPQEASAKKIEYLGHAYNGKVNKQNIPEGYGCLRIFDVQIIGTFADRTVTDAFVRIDPNTENSHDCVFEGIVTYDESNNITLKAGGELRIKCADREIPAEKEYVDYTSYFETIKIKLPQDFLASPEFFMLPSYKEPILNVSEEIVNKMNTFKYDSSIFNVPSGMWACNTYDFRLEKYDIWKKSKQRAERTEWYLIRKNKEEEKKEKRTSVFHDNIGRTWECSFFSKEEYNTKKMIYSFNNFTLHYPNGNKFSMNSVGSVKWTKKLSNGKDVIVSMDCYNCYQTERDCNPPMATLSDFSIPLSKKNLFDLWKRDNFVLSNSDLKAIDIDGVYHETPSKTVEKKIKDELYPYLANNGAEIEFEVFASGNNYGVFKNGRIVSNVYEKEKKQAEDNMKKIQAELNEGYRKYGKANYDAYLKDQVIVGMPEELILRYNPELKEETRYYKIYYLYGGNMWQPKHIYTVWVSNGKVTNVITYH